MSTSPTTGRSPIRPAHRLDGIAPTIFSEMSALAVRTGSVNMGQGFPDEDGPPSVIAKAVDALRSGANQYAPGIGVPALRQAIATHQHRHYGIELDPEVEVAVTTGATEAIASAILGLVNPGDEVIVLEPYYDSYPAMLQMAGAVRKPVTLTPPRFAVDPEAVRAAIGPNSRFLLLNSPHNPTGMVLDLSTLQQIADIAIEHDLIVITDEVYEHLVFDDAVHTPIASLPGMFERTLTISSAGKSYSFTGWKVGWATGPADLVAGLVAAKQWLTFTSGSPLQPAVALALGEEPDFPTLLAADLQQRRDLLCSGLRSAGLTPIVPQGTYFASTDVAALGWRDSREFCAALPERAGVVAIPAQAFYERDGAEAGTHLVRWAFCKQRETIEKGLTLLADADLAK